MEIVNFWEEPKKEIKKIIKLLENTSVSRLHYIEMEDGEQILKIVNKEIPVSKIINFNFYKNMFFGRLNNQGSISFQYLKEDDHIGYISVSFSGLKEEYLNKISLFLEEDLKIQDFKKIK